MWFPPGKSAPRCCLEHLKYLTTLEHQVQLVDTGTFTIQMYLSSHSNFLKSFYYQSKYRYSSAILIGLIILSLL